MIVLVNELIVILLLIFVNLQQLGELPSSEAIRSALGELELSGEDSLMEAINPALSQPTSSSTIIADVPTFPSISNQPLQPPALSAGITSSYATTTNVPQLSSTIPQLSSDVPPLSSGIINSDVRLEDIELMIDSDYSGELRPSVENAVERKWSRIVGHEFEIVVRNIDNAHKLLCKDRFHMPVFHSMVAQCIHFFFQDDIASCRHYQSNKDNIVVCIITM